MVKRLFSILYLAIGTLALVACGGVLASPTLTPSPSPEPTPIPTRELEVCPLMVNGGVESWIDQDGNGERDAEDGPLAGVSFRMVWFWDFGKTQERVKRWTSGPSGHRVVEATGCGAGRPVIQVEPPPGYRLTTSDSVCLNEDEGTYCRSFGFAPTEP